MNALRSRGRHPEAAVTAGLIAALAVQNAVPPFATDMYSPAFPQVTADLATSATAVGLTLTAFFIGMGLGQVAGGTISDQQGRRVPVIVGGVLCSLGALVCVFAPNIGVLVAGRLLQGFGGGVAAVVGRAVLVDLAHGDRLASVMSILMAVSALAPMIAPVVGGAVLSVATWRTVFWCLVGFGLFMTAMAAALVPESLPPERRQDGGRGRFAAGARDLVGHRRYLGYMLTSSFSGFAMFAYISSSSFVLQEIEGLSPMAFSVFFACTAGCQMLLSLLNARLVRRAGPRRLIALGLSISAAGATVVRARSISELATSTLASTSRWVTTLIMEKPRRSTTTTDDARMEPMTRTCKDVRHCSSDVSRRRRKYSLKTVTHRILSCSPLPAQSR